MHLVIPRACVAAVLPAVTVLAIGAETISAKPLSRDEMATFAAARLPFAQLVDATRHVDAAFLPYYALMHLTPAVSRHPVLMRAWSLAAAVVAVVFAVLIAAELWSPWWGMLAGFVLALNGAFATEAVSARSPMLAVMLTTIATYLLVRCRARSPGVTLFVGYAIAMGLSGYFNLFALVVLAPHAVAVLVWWARDRWRLLIGFGAAAVVSVALVIPLILSTRGQGSQLAWITVRSLPGAAWLVPAEAGSTAPGQRVWDVGVAVLVTALAVTVVGCAFRRREVWRYVPGVALIALTPAVLWVVSNVVRPVEIARYAVGASLGAALVVTGAARLLAGVVRRFVRHRRVAVGLATAALVGATLAGQLHELTPTFSHTSADKFPLYAADLDDAVHVGEQLVFVQNYDDTGPVAGFAFYSHDHALLAAVERAEPRGVRLVFPSVVVGTHPLRTRSLSQLHGRVLAVGRPATLLNGNPRRFWAARMTQLGCVLTAPTGRIVSEWRCPGEAVPAGHPHRAGYSRHGLRRPPGLRRRTRTRP